MRHPDSKATTTTTMNDARIQPRPTLKSSSCHTHPHIAALYTYSFAHGLDELVNSGPHLTVVSAVVAQQLPTVNWKLAAQAGEATACDAGQRRMWVKRRTSLNIID